MTTKSSPSMQNFAPESTPSFLTKEISIPKHSDKMDSKSKNDINMDTSSFGFFTEENNNPKQYTTGRRNNNTRWISSSNSPAKHNNKNMGRKYDEGREGNRRFSNNSSRNDDKKDINRQSYNHIRNTGDIADIEIDISTIDPDKVISASELRSKSFEELSDLAKEYQTPNISRLLKQDIICTILKSATSKGEIIYDKGVVELVADGFGFLRYFENNYISSSDNVYISSNQVRKFGIKTGDTVEGYAREPKRSEKYFSITKVCKINGVDADNMEQRINFSNLVPIFPKEKFNLDINIGPKDDISTRVIDLIAPIGKGQRALVVAPPRSGKTVILQNIAHAITQNHPDAELIVLLIDERPEEFTHMASTIKGEVVSSTFDEPAERHVALAEIVMSKAKTYVEGGKDCIILLDSITRLARAYNTTAPSSGKILSGGIDANALHRPKRFFGAARNINGKGSLTIIATALVDTGSRMDEVIFEEFKGRGNSEIVLERKLADKRIFPAFDVLRSGTRNEEEMVSPELLSKMWALRKIISSMGDQGKGSADAIEFLLKEVKKTPNNEDFFTRMNN